VAAICGISAMPTFQVWQGGEKKDELVGASKDKLRDLINKYTADGEEPPPK
jgi:thioredoxin 1